MLELYKNIKNERIKKGWNQTELAKRIGYSDKSMIAKIEAGKVDLPQTKIRAFAEVFGCTEGYLMGYFLEDDDTGLMKAVEQAQADGNEFAKEFYKTLKRNSLNELSEQEVSIIREFRNLDPEAQRQIVLMLAFLKDQNNKK